MEALLRKAIFGVMAGTNNKENKPNITGRIGIAEGELVLPDDFDEAFDAMDEEICQMFEDSVRTDLSL